jgi:ligand-binding sensor domain-containing protein
MKFCKYILIITLLLLLIQRGLTQNYVIRHITTQNGLAGEDVTGFSQDDKGFIWITSDGGLQRFDGAKFITYRHSDQDQGSIAYDEVFNPVFDKHGTIWLANPLSYINLLSLAPLIPRAEKIGASDAAHDLKRALFSYCRDTLKTMWVCGHNTIYKFTYYPEPYARLPDSLTCNFLNPMMADPLTNVLWIGTTSGLITYDPRCKVFADFHHNPDNNPLFNQRLEPYKLFFDKERNVWLSTWDHTLSRYNLITHSYKQYDIPVLLPNGNAAKVNDRTAGIVQDKDGNIWACSEKGSVFKYDRAQDAFSLAIAQLSGKGYSGNTEVHAMFCDTEGDIWIGASLGVYMFNPSKQKIFSVENNPFDKLSLPARQVNAIYQTSNGLVWAASRDGGGVSVFDSQIHLIKRLFDENDHQYSQIRKNAIWSFCEDRRQQLWMAARQTMVIYNLATGKVSFLKIPEMNYPVFAIKSDAEGNIWLGGGEQLIRLDPVTRKYIVFADLSVQLKAHGGEIRDVLIDRHNNFWVATRTGLFRFDTKTGKYIEAFISRKNAPQYYSPNEVLCISNYKDGELLLGTSDGLEIFNTRTGMFLPVKCSDGSLSNIVQGISSDRDGNIFTATSKGLYKINGKTHAFTYYDYYDGIADNQFYTKIYRMRDGRMLTGGLNSFIYFNPADLKNTFAPPAFQLTDFKLFGKDIVPPFMLQNLTFIRLDPDQNFFTFGFASLYYYDPSKIHYFYKLEGLDNGWVNAGTTRAASYTNLDDGDYILRIKCINDEGVSAINNIGVHIYVKARFYKTWWFILAGIVTGAAIAYGVYSYRMRTINNLALVRGRIASDLHDDIGSTLNSISVYSEVAGQLLQTNSEKAKTILETMGGASRGMIDDMNDIVWSINPKNDDFENILLRMQYFAGELLSAKNMLLQFDADENVKKIKLPMDKRKNFYLVYKEAISNACKYSESKDLNVSIAEKDKNLVMIITDNGRGFDQPKNGLGGNGLNNMKARAAAMGAQLEISSWPGKGTRVYLKLRI